MNNRSRRIITAIFAFATAGSLLGTSPAFSDIRTGQTTLLTAFAAQEISSGECNGASYEDKYEGVKLYYKTDSNGTVITGCKTSKNAVKLNIPKSLGGKKVVAVGENAFKNQTSITSVNFYGIDEPLYYPFFIGDTDHTTVTSFIGGSAVSKIGKSAFEGCTELRSVSLGNVKTKIMDKAFYGCSSLNEITFNKFSEFRINPLYSEIGDSAFEGTALTEFKCNSCDRIGNYAFADCTWLQRVDITADVIGSHAFDGCSWLKTVNINAATIHGYSFLNCSDIENINIKADRIGYHSFEDAKNLKSAVIDAKEIGEWAFSGCSALTNVTLNNTVRIERHAFQYCDELKMLDIPDTVEYIGVSAFYKDEKLSIPAFFIRDNGKTLTIDTAAFFKTNIEYAVLSGDINVKDYAFYNGKMKAAVVEGNVSLENGALGSSSSNPYLTIYGETDSSPYDPSNKIPYEKVDKSTAYDKMMDEVKPYFMGIQAGPNRFKHEGGCCAGIAIIQNLAMTGRLSFSELFPQPYNGQEITSFLQVPDDAYSAGRPEFTEFSEEAYDYWHDQSKYRDLTYRLPINLKNLDGYAKLTEYGIYMPGYVDVGIWSPEAGKRIYNHAFLFLGIEKLDTPVNDKVNGIDGSYNNYNYRMIVSENGYHFKLDENGKLLARGNDKLTWWKGISADEGWTAVENTYIYISTDDETLPCYAQRWNHPENVKPEYLKLKMNDFQVIPASAISKKPN